MWTLCCFRRISLVTMVVLVSAMLPFSAATGYTKDSSTQLCQIVEPYAFDFASWEVKALSALAREVVCGDGEVTEQTKLRRQIRTVLADDGISIYPPIVFSLEKPPHLLVVSPREKIMYLDRRVLRQDLSLSEMEQLEAEVDRLGLSSLVVDLAGFGATYPAIVGGNLSLTDTINVILEEWLHQHLTFKPLGFLYLLDSVGIRQDSDVVTMDETLADMVSQEIGAEVRARYYQGYEEAETIPNAPGFDFEAEMRETRRKADAYLSQGRIEEAELYMEGRRKEFVAHGYYIRKLNQAYFAFHGIYAQDPASVSPIYEGLKQLRAESPSIKYFLDKVATMKSYAELTEALGQ
jgi:hypothetical protein